MGKESSSLLEKRKASGIQLEEAVKCSWFWNILGQGERDGRSGQEEGLAQAGREEARWAHGRGVMEGAHLCVQLQQWTRSAWHCPRILRGAS